MNWKDAALWETMMKRRSLRRLKEGGDFGEKDLEELLSAARRVPSAFNMQSYRVLPLRGAEHEAFWDLVGEVLMETIGEERFAKGRTGEKLQGFRNGNGTILFFEDEGVHKAKEEAYPAYAQRVRDWALQGSGIFQYAVWLLLEGAGQSASLQHYNPLIDEAVARRWKVPSTWTLISQMPYGLRDDEPGERELLSLEALIHRP